jgi:enoyl-CoA hydratase
MIDVIELPNGWRRVRLNQAPKLNTLSVACLEGLLDIFSERRSDLRLTTLESDGETVFAAGADIRELMALKPEDARSYAERGLALMAAIETHPTPVWALVHGACMGGAFDLVLSCHRIYATPEARFCHPGVKLGIMTGFGGTQRLPQRVGLAAGRFAFLTGQLWNGEEALAHQVVDGLFSTPQEMIQDAKQYVMGAESSVSETQSA